MAIEPAWQKSIYIGEYEPPVQLVVEMGLAGYELVGHIGDERLVLARTFGDYNAKQLIDAITEGLEALKKASAR